MRRTMPAPRRWPSIRGSPRRRAQRPLPSMMMAMWRGILSAGTSANTSCFFSVSASGVMDIVGKDRLLPVRPHGNDFHGPAHQRAEPPEIIAGPLRQVGNAADMTDFFLPAWHRLIDGNNPPQIL